MNKRVLSVLCCVALLLSCISGLGAVAETTTAQQDCVSGATLTAINGSADAALLPTGTNLLTGKSRLAGSHGMSPNNGTLDDLYDGLYQGVNQDIVYQKNPDGTWYQPNPKYSTVGSNVADTRYVSYVKAATETELGYAQMGFDLGVATRINQITVGSSAEGANSAITHAQFSDPNFDGVETVFTKETRLHMMDIYVSDSADTLYDEGNKVIAADYLNGDISARATSLAPLVNLFTPTDATVGRYVGFRFYLAGSHSTGAVSTTYNGKTVNWGWYDQVRISELGVFGEEETAAADVTAVDITDGVNEDKIIAPEDNILKTATATSSGGAIPDRMYDGQLAGVTDGCAWEDKTTGWLGVGDSVTRKLYLTWDLGTNYEVDSFLIAGSGVSGTTYGPQATRIYVGNKTGAEIKADASAAKPVYTATDVIVFGRRVILSKAAVGRYIVFELDGYDRKDVFGNTFLTELAATGGVATAPDAPYIRTPITALTDLPGDSLIAGKTPTLADGKKPNVQSGGNLANITDGNIQGINQDVHLTLTQDTQYLTAKSGDHIYYSFIAPASVVAAQGLDTAQTWYVRPQNGRWMHSNTEAQRAVLYGGTSNGGNIVYDLGSEATIESLLIASSLELSGLTNDTYYDGEYDASKHPTMTDAQVTAAYAPAVDNRLLYKAKVYVGDSRDTIFNESNLVLDFDLSANYADAWRNLWELKEAATGRYVGFALNDTIMSSSNQLVRVSELGVYGTVATEQKKVTLYKADEMTANMTPVANNVLAQAVAANYRAGATGGPTSDAKMLGALVDGTYGGEAAQKLCPGGNDYFYFTYDLGKVYSLDTLTFVGDGSDGANSVAVYVGVDDWATAYANNVEPDAFYDGAIGTTSRQTNNKTGSIGIRFNFATPLLGRYVTFRLQGCLNGKSMQVWAAEFAATGKDATVAPYMPEELPARLPSADKNVLAQAQDAYYRASNSSANSTHNGLKTTLVNGVVAATDAVVLTPDADYVYITYDMGTPYDFTSLLFAGVGTDGANSVAVWVGNDKLAAIISKDIAPNAFYDGGIGTSERVTNNKTGAVAVGFNLTATGRYVTFRLATCRNASYQQVWLSEFAAVGKASPITSENVQTIVCVGDSITHGTVFTTPDTNSWGAIQLANGYPAQLENLLNEAADEDVYYNVINAGISASAVIGVDQTIPGTENKFPASGNAVPTTWLVEQEARGLNYVQSADKVLIMLGTNDAHNAGGTWSARAPYYKEYYKKIIDAFRAENPEVEIYVVTSPYTSVGTHYNNLENGVVPQQKQLAAELGLPLIDVYEATKYHVEVLNGGDLSSFIDSNDISKGLCLHPDEEGQGVIAKACFDALVGDQNDLYTVKADGAQLRDYEGGIPTGDMDLRFSMTLPVTGVTRDGNYNTQLTADSKIVIAGKAYTVTDFGALVAIEDKVEDKNADLFVDGENAFVKKVAARKLYNVTEDDVTFTAVVTKVSEANYNNNLVARGYVQYQDGDVTRYAYGPICIRSVSEVVSAHTASQYEITYGMWNGYKEAKFTVGDVACEVVMPDVEAAEGRPWIWRTEFFGHRPETDQELLDAGWHVAYCKVSNMYGSPASIALMKSFYDVAVPLFNLKRQTVLEGFSRGGLYAVNFAATYPEATAGLYLDAPVQDICSWPGYLYTDNTYDATQVGNYKHLWSSCRSQYGFSSDAEALADRTASPRWKYGTLIENNIPVLLVYGDADNVVLFSENGQHLVDAYTAASRTDLLKVQCFTGRGHSHGWTGEASAHILSAMN